LRMDEIGERMLRRYSQQRADILIQPDVGHCPWFDFGNARRLIVAGLEAGRTAIANWQREQPERDYPSSRIVPDCVAYDALAATKRRS
ncbi:MAG: hypothetical protein KDA72_22820, partial [Planctomycetales bacterium]|nr:hypothetical protein [Planctomycetales bacterium]